VAQLKQRSINTSVASIASGRWDFGARGLTTAVRASPHYYNDEGDLDRLTAAVQELARGQVTASA